MLRKYQLLLIVAASMNLILLAGCGPNYSTPGSSEPSPTPTASSGPVALHVGASSYRTSDPIEVTLRNAGTSTIYFPDHLTNCTVIQLQRQVNGGWVAVNKCLLMIATHWHTLDAGQSLTVKLVPEPGRPWMVGIYQATLTYKTSPEAGPLTPIYSAEFQIS